MVRVTARASRDTFAADGDHFTARLAAAPVDGAANAALIALVADQFGLAKRNVTLVSGETARRKRLALSGDPDALEAKAASLYGLAP